VANPVSNSFTDDEIKQLETVYRRIAVISNEDGAYEYVIQPAQKLQWRAFRGAANDEDKRADAQEQLIKACVVAVKYNGEASSDVDSARKLLDRLLADYTSAADGKEISRLIFKVNGQAGARGK
jgi:hypothetical protein